MTIVPFLCVDTFYNSRDVTISEIFSDSVRVNDLITSKQLTHIC